MRLSRLALATSAIALVGIGGVSASAVAQDALVEPYLQYAQTDSIWVSWEMDGEGPGQVAFGLTESLGTTVESTAVQLRGGGVLHEAQLTELMPATRYHYQVTSGDFTSPMRDFITPPTRDMEADFRVIAFSDMQRGVDADKFREVVEDGVIGWVEEMYGVPLAEALAMVLIPGDLVQTGSAHDDWTDEFFGPMTDLMAHVPVYPAAGNHEDNHHFYFDYFRLPSNGSDFYDEHWWTLDYSNVRIITLDTNVIYRIPPQLEWLDGVLAETCNDEDIQFVVMQLHHPALSELWRRGEEEFSRLAVERLEQFSTDCSTPSVHLYGHTHGYARGESRDHQHVGFNVGSAGGSIDDWGDDPQWDHPEVSKSLDEYGFLLLEFQAGDDPRMGFTFVSRGDSTNFLDNVVSDTLEIRLNNTPPRAPQPVAPAGAGVAAECATLAWDGAFEDADGDTLHGVHWQVSDDCEGFSNIVADAWQQDENWFYDEDLQADADLTRAVVRGMPGDADLCWRVRVRDQGLVWSDWSVAVPLHTDDARVSDNLLENPGAERNLDGWQVVEGNVEANSADECDGHWPTGGRRLFVLGGVCDPTPAGEMTQDVDVTDWSDAIAAGTAEAYVAAQMATFVGLDSPSIWVEFLDDTDASLGTSEPLVHTLPQYTRHEQYTAIPAGTVTLRLHARGERVDGEGTDAYIDDIELRVAPNGQGDCAAEGDGEIPDPPEPADVVEPVADVGVPDTSEDVGVDVPDTEVDTDTVDTTADVPQADVGADTDDNGGVSGGGGCTTAPASGGPCALAVGLLGLLFVRRRR